jgi:CRP-like cAMP-binding protein
MDALYPHTLPLIRKLDSITTLSGDDRAALLRLPMQVRDLRADQDIVREGDQPSQCCLILEGFAATYKLGPKGKRQIMAFHIPGDIPDLQGLHMEVMDTNLATISACKVAFIRHPHMRELCHSHPRLADVFWRETLIDASIFREWMLCLGRRSASQHMAHLFCEFLTRLKTIGLVQDDSSFDFPITQAELGDALGLSNVHVNRVTQELRASNLIAWERNTVTVLDWDGLVELGEFDPTYLHLTRKKAA